MNLPARVRVTCPPLPLAPALRASVQRLCPDVPPDQVQAVAVAIAGGSVIGAYLRGNGMTVCAVEPGWRGRGIEEALAALLNT